jgi:hypothetical protein
MTMILGFIARLGAPLIGVAFSAISGLIGLLINTFKSTPNNGKRKKSGIASNLKKYWFIPVAAVVGFFLARYILRKKNVSLSSGSQVEATIVATQIADALGTRSDAPWWQKLNEDEKRAYNLIKANIDWIRQIDDAYINLSENGNSLIVDINLLDDHQSEELANLMIYSLNN